jgi:hypothetical protein
MPEDSTTSKPRYAKVHSQVRADEYQRLGWILRKEFRDQVDEEPYEYLLEWAREGEPVRPRSEGTHGKA